MTKTMHIYSVITSMAKKKCFFYFAFLTCHLDRSEMDAMRIFFSTNTKIRKTNAKETEKNKLFQLKVMFALMFPFENENARNTKWLKMKRLFNKSSFNTIYELIQLNKEQRLLYIWATNVDFNWANITSTYQPPSHATIVYNNPSCWAFDSKHRNLLIRTTYCHTLFTVVPWGDTRFVSVQFFREVLSSFGRCNFNFVLFAIWNMM